MSGLLLALAAVALQPPAAPARLAGVWEGTVGTLPVRACFVAGESGPFGGYYYLSRLQLIPLHAVEGQSGTFGEQSGHRDNPRWRVVEAGAARLTARWTSGRRTLPVRLWRLALPADEENPCASLAFHQPRLAGIRTVTARATYSGVDFTTLTLDTRERYRINVRTFALDGDSPAIRRVNAALAAPLAGTPPRWFECVGMALQGGERGEGEYQEELTPVTISRRWLSVLYQQGGYCGGAHPDGSSTYRLFDLTSGAEANAHDWFNASAVRRERVDGADEAVRTMLPALRNFILATWVPREAECGEVIRSADDWTIGLSGDGFIFAPQLAHAVAVCEEEWTYSFDQLRPFLTPDALAQIAALRAERR